MAHVLTPIRRPGSDRAATPNPVEIADATATAPPAAAGAQPATAAPPTATSATPGTTAAVPTTTTSRGSAPGSTRWRALGGGAALLSIGVAVQAVSNIGFHAVTSRSLSAVGYVDVATLLACTIMLTVPLGALQAAYARAVAVDPGADRRRATRQLAIAAVLVGAVLVLAAGPLQAGLDLSSRPATLLLAPFLAVSIALAGHRGIGLGERRFALVAASFAVPALLRLAGGAVLTPLAGVPGAMAATLASETAGLVLLLVLGRRRTERARRVVPAPNLGRVAPAHLTLGWRDVAGTGAAVVGLWLLTSSDLFLARGLLGAEASSGYVAAATIARSIMAIPVAVVMAALPSFAADRDAGRGALRRALVLGGAAAATGLLAVVVAPDLLQTLLFGRVLAPTGLVTALATIAVGGAAVTTFVYYFIAQRRRAALLAWAGAAVEVTLIVSAHGSPAAVAAASAVATAATVAVLAIVATRSGARSATHTAPTTRPAGRTRPVELPIAIGPPYPLWAPADPDVDLSVVLPFYNPGDAVARTITDLGDAMRRAGIRHQVLAVSDGSTDDSAASVAALADPAVELIELPLNQGKGAAVRTGFARATGEYVAFIDADGDIAPSHLVDYLERARAGGHDLVYASKRHPDAVSEATAGRKVISRGFSTFVSCLFRLGVDDTQTGAKLLRRELAADVFPWLQERRFALDLELFVVARRRGHRALHAAPVHLGERLAGSTVTSRAVLRTLRDALTIWVRLHLTRAYPTTTRTPRAAGSPAPTAVRRIRTSRPVAVPAHWSGPSTDPVADLLADDLAA